MSMVICPSCTNEVPASAPRCKQCGTARPAISSNGIAPAADDAIPDGVRGWSWGAFLITWIWAIGNRTWIGLLALVPYLGIGVAIWMGCKGREMAWKNGTWDSVEHFNQVQRSWSQWGFGVIGLLCLWGVINGYQSSRSPVFSESTVKHIVAPGHQQAVKAPVAPAQPVVAQL